MTSNLHDSDYDEENVADDDIEGSDYEYHPRGDDKHDVSDAMNFSKMKNKMPNVTITITRKGRKLM